MRHRLSHVELRLCHTLGSEIPEGGKHGPGAALVQARGEVPSFRAQRAALHRECNAVKPGQCPPERYADPTIFRSNCTYCVDDGDCPTDKKCCKDNFDRICKVPAADRLGTCPVAEPGAKRKDDCCTSDSECAGVSKCCFINGHMTCLPSVGEKKGYCNHNPMQCFIPGRDACANDSGCPNDEKCCSFECARQCRPPLEEKPGMCPPERVHVPDRFNDSRCESDEGCLMDQKCCLDNDDKFCKPPAREKLGQCPPTYYSTTPMKDREDFCSSDSECDGNLKCCLMETGRTCSPSLGDKPGVCPPYPLCIRAARATCANDSGCVNDLKCCNSKCGTGCVTPDKGFCPPNVLPPGIGATPCDVRCTNCSKTEMCCSYGCSLICRPISQERPGFCPYSPKLCLPRTVKCMNDTECPDNMKCCESDCEKKCVPLLKEKPGTCPAPDTQCMPTNGSSTPICSSDYHCLGSQKCCIVGCSNNCTEPQLV